VSWAIEYADDDSYSGYVLTGERVTLGPYTIDEAHVQVATKATVRARSTEMSGVLGLAKAHASTVTGAASAPRILDQVVGDRSLGDDAFLSVDLRSNGSAGFVSLGTLDTSTAKGGLVWVDNHPDHGHWVVDVKKLGANWTSSENGGGGGGRTYGVVDTGCTVLMVPPEVAVDYYMPIRRAYQMFSPDSAWIFPCDQSHLLPDFYVELEGGFGVNIPGRYMNFGPTAEEGKTCFGGLQSSDGIGEKVILGNVLNKAIFLAFDLRGKKIGFAEKDVEDHTA
jgi:hypothetical protein